MNALDKNVDSVQVALRIRPLVESERARGCEECVEVCPGEPQVQVKDLAFTYNYVFPPSVDQQEFYDTAVKKLIFKLFQGYNVTILAYGQTGSGKTHSMGTNYTGSETDRKKLGIIPQAVADIFDYVETHEQDYNFRVAVSFLELYQEQCYDLLSTKSRSDSVIEIREDHNGIVLPGLTEREVVSSSETMVYLMTGSEGRAVGATAMNATSSRSHAIFTLYITQENKADRNESTTSKFHLVDLAGSERAKKTQAIGDRLKEGIKINQGLLTLGTVISQLGDPATQQGFICYRQSKLTRLLQDSLGGNSLTLMIACVSPADYNLEETVSTLRYADRARRIKNKPIVNQDPKNAEIVRLNKLVSELKMQLMNHPGGPASSTDNTKLGEELERQRKRYNELLTKHKTITEILNNALLENTNLCEKALLAECAKDKMERKLLELTEKCNVTIENINATFDAGSGDSAIDKKCLLESLHDMQSKLEDLNSEHKRCNEELIAHDVRRTEGQDGQTDNQHGQTDNHHDGDSSVGDDPHDDASTMNQQEALTMGQVALNKELQELNQAMALKSWVVKKITENTKELVNYDESLKINEARIISLEKEKNELMQQLKNKTKAKTDPAMEERRGKVVALETEISTLKKKCQQQASLIRMKEKNEEKITALNKEIQSMKVAKVNLIKTMRVESEKFRKWKQENERSMCRMRAEDRKRQTAMAKMESMHTKQQNVLKRKMEEAVAINKRLKEALDKQKLSQIKRSKSTNKTEQVQQWIEQELEVQLSTVDAERTLEELMEDRGIITAQLDQLKADTDNAEGHKARIEQLQDDLTLRKVQISDLQQKILAVDQDNKSRTRWDNVQSMLEAKAAMKYLFDLLVETKRDIQTASIGAGSKDAALQEHLEEMQERHRVLQQDYERATKDYQRQLATLELQQEHKVKQLMMVGRDVTVRGDGNAAVQQLQHKLRLQEEQLDKLEEQNDKLVRELDKYRSIPMDTELDVDMHTPDTKPKKVKKPKAERHAAYVESDEDEDEDLDEDDDDPDWRATPMYKRLHQAQRSRMTMNFTQNNLNPMDSTTNNVGNNVTVNTTQSTGSSGTGTKRSSDGQTRCSCRGSCSTKMCGCRKGDAVCSDSCKCQKVLCKNRKSSTHTHSHHEDDKENSKPGNLTHYLDDESPNLCNSLRLNDMTASAKKKRYFFYPPSETTEGKA